MIQFNPPPFTPEEQRALVKTFEETVAVRDSPIEILEESFADLCEVKHAVAVSSGTAALQVALIAHNVRDGDEVITPSFTSIATINAIMSVGGGMAYGSLGVTHHATEDIAIMRALPNMVVVAPNDPVEARLATRGVVAHDGPCYLRLGRAGEATIHSSGVEFQLGKAITVREGNDLPRSIPFIDGMLVFLTTGGSCYSIRLVERLRQRRRNRSANNTRVAIIGAGEAGAMIVKEMQENPQLGLEPIVFLDDDPQRHGAWIHSVPVVGDRNKIPDVVKTYHVQQAIIAMPTAPGKTIRELTRLCLEAGLAVRTVPGIYELLDGSVTVNQLRPVDIADLLRRDFVVTDIHAVGELVKGKRVLVTGAGAESLLQQEGGNRRALQETIWVYHCSLS